MREGNDCLSSLFDGLLFKILKNSESIASIHWFNECSLEIYLYMKEKKKKKTKEFVNKFQKRNKLKKNEIKK